MVVTNRQKPVGIVTDRALALRVVAKGRDGNAVRVGELKMAPVAASRSIGRPVPRA